MVIADAYSLDFTMRLPLLKASEESVHGEKIRFVSGVASLEVADQQNETVIQKGIDYSPFLDTGFINWDHGDIRKGSPAYLIGEPTLADVRQHRGVPAFYIEGFLYPDKPMANEAWEHLLATAKSMSKRQTGWSIQGQTLAAQNGRILKSVVRDVALTHKPVLRETVVSFQEICKSLDENGHLDLSLLNRSATTETLGPVMKEDLFGADRGAGRRNPMKGKSLEAILEAIYGPGVICKSNHFDNRGHFRNGALGALDHLVECRDWPVDEAEILVRTLREAFL